MLHADKRGGTPTAFAPQSPTTILPTASTPPALTLDDIHVQVRTHEGLDVVPLSQVLGLHADGLLRTTDYEDAITGELGLTVVLVVEDGGAA